MLTISCSANSATKKLHEHFDKQPRWLRPSDENDMIRRCEQLEKSPTRSGSTYEWPTSREHSHSAPSPFNQDMFPPIKEERGAYSATLDFPPSYSWTEFESNDLSHSHRTPAVEESGRNSASSNGRLVSADVGGLASRITRRCTRMSTLTDRTTGTLNRILENYPEQVVQAVRGLVKRFTAPLSRRMSLSHTSDAIYTRPSWVNDADAPSAFNSRPFPLPSDFLRLDDPLQSQTHCFHESEEHQKRWCMCFARSELHDAWVTAWGLNLLAAQLVRFGPTQSVHMEDCDAFGNTILHLLAARGSVDMLFQVLHYDNCSKILNSRNSAGQTFLHVLDIATLPHIDSFCKIMDLLATKKFSHCHIFDFSSRDHYGRTLFHLLLLGDLPSQTLQSILYYYSGFICSVRDAFNVTPIPQYRAAPTTIQRVRTQDLHPGPPTFQPQLGDLEGDDDPFIAKQSDLLKVARWSSEDPKLEDSEGRNGLQCLAMATLSQLSMLEKIKPLQWKASRSGKNSQGTNPLDSSEEKLAFRLQLAEGLISSGVELNHYDCFGNTPLMAFAAELPEDDDQKIGPMILNLLLSRGANVHARNRAGETALHIAVRCGRKLAVKTLLEKGANVYARDAAGRSVLAVADAKMKSCMDDNPRDYAHFEACRAHLSGKGFAVQEPSVLQEWGVRSTA